MAFWRSESHLEMVISPDKYGFMLKKTLPASTRSRNSANLHMSLDMKDPAQIFSRFWKTPSWRIILASG